MKIDVRAYNAEAIKRLCTIDERLAGIPVHEITKRVPAKDLLQCVPMEDRLQGVPAKDLLKCLSFEEIEAHMRSLKKPAAKSTRKKSS